MFRQLQENAMLAHRAGWSLKPWWKCSHSATFLIVVSRCYDVGVKQKPDQIIAHVGIDEGTPRVNKE